MGRRRLAAALLVAALGAAACTESASGPRADRSPRPTPSPSPTVVINPPGLVLDNVAFGRSRRRVARAIRDLETIGFWRPLTRHLYKLKIGSRLGVVNVPEDGHLADAILTAAFDEEAQGRACDVMFFPNAIAQDLDRWRLYWGQAAIGEPPPTMRHFWGSVLAHELAHCLPGNPGEKVAEEWEARALRKLSKLE
jgi:hypothetical protein